MTYLQRTWAFLSQEPPPRNPAVDRFVLSIGIIGAPIEITMAAFTDSESLIGLIMRFIIFAYSCGAMIISYRTTWGRTHSPTLTFYWLILVLIQEMVQNYLHGFRFDDALIMFMTYPIGAMFIHSPRQLLSYVFLTTFVVVVGLVLMKVPPEFANEPTEYKTRLAILFLYVSLAAIAVFLINFRLLAQLRQATERYKIVSDNTSDLIALHDLNGITQYMSPSVKRLTGYPIEDLLGKSAFHLIYDADREQTKVIYRQLYSNPQTPVQLEYRIRKADGSLLWVEAVGASVLGEDGKISQIVTATRDISRRKDAELEKESKNAELLRINRELDQFAYVVSHDLKAPMRGISALTTFIEEDLDGIPLPPEVSQHLKLLRQRTERLERLINDVLAYSRAGKAQSTAEIIDTRRFFEELGDLVALPQGFQVVLHGNFPTILATRIYFEQVFTNLLTNAYHHHDKETGNITIAVSPMPGGWEFALSDDGPGIDPKHYERVFEVFSQLNAKDFKKGTGIGLAVVRKILDQIHGSVKLEPNSPRGVTFKVFWPEKVPHLDNTDNSL